MFNITRFQIKPLFVLVSLLTSMMTSSARALTLKEMSDQMHMIRQDTQGIPALSTALWDG
jgi:hypothetical protein